MPPRPRPASALRRLLGAPLALLGAALYLLWLGLVVAVPALAAWVASSLAAHAGGSACHSAALGLLLFPVAPLLWEGFSAWRRSRASAPSKRFLTFADRLVLRTMALSALFLGALLTRSPQRVFVALNARGDWMLDGRHDARSEQARRGLFWAAARSEWLYRLTDDNPFHARGARPRPQPLPGAELTARRGEESSASAPLSAPVPPRPPRDPRAWPEASAGLHRAVLALPPEQELSPESVGRFLASRESDPHERARAAHDYVADRVAYDVEAYRSGVYPPQDAGTTFRSRRSVCAGYASLFTAVARAAGLEVETVVGRARHFATEGAGEGHAWNAVRLDGRWHLVDTTWDSGTVDAQGFHKRFRTMYFLTPPEVFIVRHFPDEARWQLLPAARTVGEYLRAPVLEPEFFAQGLRLRSPERAESDAHGAFEALLENPEGASLLASVRPQDGAARHCSVTSEGSLSRVRCELTGPDAHQVIVYSSPERGATHWGVAWLRVHNR